MKVYLVGSPKSGKSTFINYLLGHEVIRKERQYLYTEREYCEVELTVDVKDKNKEHAEIHNSIGLGLLDPRINKAQIFRFGCITKPIEIIELPNVYHQYIMFPDLSKKILSNITKSNMIFVFLSCYLDCFDHNKLDDLTLDELIDFIECVKNKGCTIHFILNCKSRPAGLIDWHKVFTTCIEDLNKIHRDRRPDYFEKRMAFLESITSANSSIWCDLDDPTCRNEIFALLAIKRELPYALKSEIIAAGTELQARPGGYIFQEAQMSYLGSLYHVDDIPKL
jgi:hypothetical protein